tara:strand:+ start:2005 stop:3279 length:1275 start_codon:yes stop_codon:yes gene_type:complete
LINLNKLTYFFTFSFPLALLLGRFTTDLIVSLSSLLIILIFLKYRSYREFFDIYAIIFFIFSLYMIVRSLFSIDPILSLEASLFYFRFGLFFLAVLFSIKFYKDWIKMFFYSFLLAYLLIIIICFVEIFFKFNLTIYLLTGYNAEVQNAVYSNKRITGIFGTDIMLGSFISRTIPIFVASLILFYENNKSKYLHYVAILFIPILFFLNLLSFERSAIIYFLIFIIVFCLFNQKFKKISLLLLFLLLIIFTSSLFLIKSFFNRLITTTLSQGNFVEKPIFSIPDIYIAYFNTAYNIFLENIFFGVGTKIYRLECKNHITLLDSCNTHPHNYYVQILAELGLVGFIPIALLFSVIIYKVTKHIYSVIIRNNYLISDYKLCLFISCIIGLFPFLPTGSFYNNYTSAILFLTFAILAHSSKNYYKKQQ